MCVLAHVYSTLLVRLQRHLYRPRVYVSTVYAPTGRVTGHPAPRRPRKPRNERCAPAVVRGAEAGTAVVFCVGS